VVYVIYRQRTGAKTSTAEACLVGFLFVLIPVQDTLRRAAFARLRPWAGLRLSAVRNIPPPIALLYAFPATHAIDLFDIVLVLVLANFASVIIDMTIDRPRIPGLQFATQMIRRHWRVSRWLLLSSLFNSAYEQIFTVASGMAFGDRAVAAIRISQQV